MNDKNSYVQGKIKAAEELMRLIELSEIISNRTDKKALEIMLKGYIEIQKIVVEPVKR